MFMLCRMLPTRRDVKVESVAGYVSKTSRSGVNSAGEAHFSNLVVDR